jgi:hypothetical protein
MEPEPVRKHRTFEQIVPTHELGQLDGYLHASLASRM